jgi:hypothetical protein
MKSLRKRLSFPLQPIITCSTLPQWGIYFLFVHELRSNENKYFDFWFSLSTSLFTINGYNLFSVWDATRDLIVVVVRFHLEKTSCSNKPENLKKWQFSASYPYNICWNENKWLWGLMHKKMSMNMNKYHPVIAV